MHRIVERISDYLIEDGPIIASVIARGLVFIVYDIYGRQLFAIPTGQGKNLGLMGYTGNSVTVRRTPLIYTYNSRGQMISSFASYGD